MTHLVWFRSDLRLHDNPALTAAVDAAAADCEPVVGLFCYSVGQWREHGWGDPRIAWTHSNVAQLSQDLATAGIPLLLRSADRFDDIPAVVADLASKRRASDIYANFEYEVNEQQRDRAVAAGLSDRGISMHTFHDQVVVPPGEVTTKDGGFYKVFTPFRRAWLEAVEDRGGLPDVGTAPSWSGIPAPRLEPDPVPQLLPGVDLARLPATAPLPGERAALAALAGFIGDGLADYADRRDIPSLPGTSSVSPWLAVGALAPMACFRAAQKSNGGLLRGADKGADSWISELVWREFYRHVLVGYPRICRDRAFRPQADAIPWDNDPDLFAAWQQGMTGVPIVDAGMRQLAATGWMHNRVRMIVAMFLTKNLLTDWRWGERHFMGHLIDGDFASNNGGWQWSASTGTDAAPYFRIYNPFSQSKRWDPTGAYIRRWVPELGRVPDAALHDPDVLTAAGRDRLEYPEVIVDMKASRERAIAVFGEVLGSRS